MQILWGRRWRHVVDLKLLNDFPGQFKLYVIRKGGRSLHQPRDVTIVARMRRNNCPLMPDMDVRMRTGMTT